MERLDITHSYTDIIILLVVYYKARL